RVYALTTQPEPFDGVLSTRIVAFIVDAILIVLLMIPAALIVLVLGIITLGIGWLLFIPLFPIVALLHYSLNPGGPASASMGMRVAGIELRTWSGARMFPLL